ncbi:hypothetical protein [Pyrobaculum neutrophilum]|uniref:Uncharacterized protein n=1 Tax=Pyrobaculum neutrophilum (strain DSM 2338 / JCM 9278 / NBRC 100436 / V24Sta) TaxID=444157 RepID=B1YDN0_PYRNV|nr:hypothetical protein [Pyrobaculum neutrophilum]ACB39893.1 conserved hypothetical protein [Pyrobaculum neutrophilum V24Sta]
MKEIGFSPFGGVNFDVSVVGGIYIEDLPEELKKAVADKPLLPPTLPTDGWELVDIAEQEPAVAETTVETSRGKFDVRVVAEVVMVSRNINYKTPRNEPVYWAYWVSKVSWTQPRRG